MGSLIWLEIISIRAAGIEEAGKVFEICRQMVQSIAVGKQLNLAVFCNARYATDISIHLEWKSDPGSASVLGSEVSSALGDLGLISHTLWVEQEELDTDTISEKSWTETGINEKVLRR